MITMKKYIFRYLMKVTKLYIDKIQTKKGEKLWELHVNSLERSEEL